jgi:hypothetical protein
MWGTQKFQELLKKIYLKYLYNSETLIPFEVLPLRLDAAIPAPLPMLETLSKILTEMLSRVASELDNVSSIGSGAGIAASSRRGSTSKGTKVSNLYKYFK